ncbi:MAG: hypothetical protein ACI93R_003190 [Flavobacteriales bacterium]|jgi:hypothetical protein
MKYAERPTIITLVLVSMFHITYTHMVHLNITLANNLNLVSLNDTHDVTKIN